MEDPILKEEAQYISVIEAGQLAHLGNSNPELLRKVEESLRMIEARIAKRQSQLSTEKRLMMYLAAIEVARPLAEYAKINAFALRAFAFPPDTADGHELFFDILSFGVYAAVTLIEKGGKADVLKASIPLANRLAEYVAAGRETPNTRKAIAYYAHLCKERGIGLPKDAKEIDRDEIPQKNENLFRFVMEKSKGSSIGVYWQVAKAAFKYPEEELVQVSKFAAYADVESGYFWRMVGHMSSHLGFAEENTDPEENLLRIVKALRPTQNLRLLEDETQNASSAELFAASAYMLIIGKSLIRIHSDHDLKALQYGSKEEKTVAKDTFLGLSYRLYQSGSRKGFPKGLDPHYLEKYFTDYGKEIAKNSPNLPPMAKPPTPPAPKPIAKEEPHEQPKKAPAKSSNSQGNSNSQKPSEISSKKSDLDSPIKPALLTYFLIGIPVALFLSIVIVKIVKNQTTERAHLEQGIGDGVATPTDTPPDMRNPQGVVRGFFYYMGKQDYRSAYNLGQNVPAWRSFDEFSASNGFGGIDSSSIHRLTESSVNEDQSKIEVEAFMRDPVNGDGTFIQEFEVSYTGEVWRITKHRTISSDRPQDNFKFEVKAGKHPLSDGKILQEALQYFPNCRIQGNAIVGCRGSSKEDGSPEHTLVGLKHYFKQNGNTKALVLLQTSLRGNDCDGNAYAAFHSEFGFTSAGLFELQNGNWEKVNFERGIVEGDGWGLPGEIQKVEQFGLDNLAVKMKTGSAFAGVSLGYFTYVGTIDNQLKEVLRFQYYYDDGEEDGGECWEVGYSFARKPNARYNTLKLEKTNCPVRTQGPSKSVEIEFGANGRYDVPKDF